jgi:hypothetical protein
VIVYVNRTDDVLAQQTVDLFAAVAGERSIRAAVETETNWPDDLIHYASVTRIGDTETYDVAGISYIGFVIELEAVF